MPLFFFDVAGCEMQTGDRFGIELPDIAAATVEAAALAGELLKDRPSEFQEWRLAVEDSEGVVLVTILVSAIKSPAGTAVLIRREAPYT